MQDNKKKLEILKFIINNKNKSLSEIITIATKIACGYLKIIVCEYQPENNLLKSKIEEDKRFILDVNEHSIKNIFIEKKNVIFSNKNNEFQTLPKEFKDLYCTALGLPIPENKQLIGIIIALNSDENIPTNKDIENIEFALHYSIKIFEKKEKYNDHEKKIIINDKILEISQNKLIIKNREIYLSENETKILELLFIKRNKITKHNEIFNYCWPNEKKSLNILDVNIFRLRKKIKSINNGKDIIRTIRSKGYKIK